MFCPIRVEQFSREEVDLKLGVSLDFDVPTTDLSDVRQMMDSINVLPGQTPTNACLYLRSLGSIHAIEMLDVPENRHSPEVIIFKTTCK